MLRHAYYKAYFPVDSGTPPLELANSGDHLVVNAREAGRFHGVELIVRQTKHSCELRGRPHEQTATGGGCVLRYRR